MKNVPADDDASKPPTLATLCAEEQTFAARIARISRELRDEGHRDEASVLDHVQAALSGDDKAVAIVAGMAKLTRPKRGKGGQLKGATSMFPKLVQRVAFVREKGANDVTIAEQLIRFFEQWLAPSPHAAALLADKSKLAKLAKHAPKKFVKAVHRALGHPNTDSLDASERTAKAKSPRVREIRARSKARVGSATNRD